MAHDGDDGLSEDEGGGELAAAGRADGELLAQSEEGGAGLWWDGALVGSLSFG